MNYFLSFFSRLITDCFKYKKVVNLYFSLCFTSLFLAILTTVSKYEKLPENGHSKDLHSHGINPA
jgi:hypothetical protein